jgi:hypothetical protein
MARKRTAVNENALELLKHFVKAKSSLDCSTFSHIHQLQQDIQQATGEYLSLQTLNRLFGIIRTGFNPSVHTLDTLARYIDYKSFHEFATLNAGKCPEKVSVSLTSKFLVSLFASIGVEEDMGPGILHVIKNVVKLMAEDRQLASEVYYGMAASPFGRRYFFEQFINMDALDSVYGDGLQYYLLNADSRQQKFFAYTLYCYRYFLTGNHCLFREYFNLLNEFRQSEIISFPPMFSDRYYAILVLNLEIRQSDMGDTGDLEKGLIDFDMLSAHARSFYAAGYLVGEALLLTGQFEKAWQTVNAIEKSQEPADCLQEEISVYIEVLKLASGFFSSHLSRKRALALLERLEDGKLPVLSKDYLTLLLLFVKRSLYPKGHTRKEINEQIEQLVKKTGFAYISKYNLLLDKSASIIV